MCPYLLSWDAFRNARSYVPEVALSEPSLVIRTYLFAIFAQTSFNKITSDP